jgi:hypothetical protein
MHFIVRGRIGTDLFHFMAACGPGGFGLGVAAAYDNHGPTNDGGTTLRQSEHWRE